MARSIRILAMQGLNFIKLAAMFKKAKRREALVGNAKSDLTYK